jgi:hypothetical protein
MENIARVLIFEKKIYFSFVKLIEINQISMETLPNLLFFFVKCESKCEVIPK